MGWQSLDISGTLLVAEVSVLLGSLQEQTSKMTRERRVEKLFEACKEDCVENMHKAETLVRTETSYIVPLPGHYHFSTPLLFFFSLFFFSGLPHWCGLLSVCSRPRAALRTSGQDFSPRLPD